MEYSYKMCLMNREEEKMQAAKVFLKENGIAYKENHFSKRCGIYIPLAVPAHRLAIRIGDDEEFFLKTRGKYYPIFIRESDDKEKVIEKVSNTIIKSMTAKHNSLMRKKGKK